MSAASTTATMASVRGPIGSRPRLNLQMDGRDGMAMRGGEAAGAGEAGVETVLATGDETD
ncbi:hypothetical protein RSO01_46870 [Reyranella soli]|uniref:Uncharacterized protein n=1 Tax=Reyranella soli TaxID=1230389 RepID=A0A512NEY8_9HYPH|nr:hypothetical protein RSO01_46870 [Reyranella soli]